MTISRAHLPRQWIKAPLKDLVQPNRPKHSPQDYPKLQFIGMENIEAHSMKLLGTVPASSMRSNAVHFYPGDVLYGRLRPYLNKVYCPDFEGLCSAEFIVFPAREWLHPKFLQYFLNWSVFVSFASHLNAGDRPRVDFDQIGEYPTPLAPFKEQERIVAEIEKQFTGLDAAVAALKRVQANLKRYRASVLKAACEGRLVPTEAELARREGRSYEPASVLLDHILTKRRSHWETKKSKSKYQPPAAPDLAVLPVLPAGWTWATVDQLTALEPNAITDGPFGSNLKTEHYTESGPRVIRLQNIGVGNFADFQAHISDVRFERLAKHQVKAGDIVIAALGERPPRSCLIPPSVGPAIVKADCIRFRPSPKIALPEFLNLVLNAEPTRKRTSAIVHGVGRPRLNLGEIKAIAIPLPPLTEQTRITAEAERRFSVLDKVGAQTADAAIRAERLRQSILKRAFEGRLVPQDPNDEPAGALLERIRGTAIPGCASPEPNLRPSRRTPPRPKETANV